MMTPGSLAVHTHHPTPLKEPSQRAPRKRANNDELRVRGANIGGQVSTKGRTLSLQKRRVAPTKEETEQRYSFDLARQRISICSPLEPITYRDLELFPLSLTCNSYYEHRATRCQ